MTAVKTYKVRVESRATFTGFDIATVFATAYTVDANVLRFHLDGRDTIFNWSKVLSVTEVADTPEA